MHHADLEFDVTTGVRFHPIEILLSMVIKIGVVVALGAPTLAILIFEVLLNATSMFNHGNAVEIFLEITIAGYRVSPASAVLGRRACV
jgi:sterol desaturase/sphingolipid hydroxylase (fatty acid hydroxylase superfamily)